MFFTPDAKAGQIHNLVGYCLAHAANKYNIRVHACVFMSNHYHADVTDPDGNIVAFKQLFHSMLARGINALRGRFETVWNRDKACDTRRPTKDAKAMRDLVYTLTNPVKDGLVKWGDQWEGFTTYGWRFEESRRFRKPSFLFDPQGNMPEHVNLTLHRPPIYSHLSDDELFDLIMDAVRKCEIGWHETFRRSNRRFVGVGKLRRQRWNVPSRSFEERFTQTPGVAAKSTWSLLAELQRDREWEREYAKAREQLLAGRNAVFPAGTYWLRRFAGVQVADRAPP